MTTSDRLLDPTPESVCGPPRRQHSAGHTQLDAPQARRSRYRSHASTPRDRQVPLRLTDEDLVALAAAARLAGLTVSGYAAEAAVAAAAGASAPSLAPWREAIIELIQARTQLRRVGTNLNQAIRILNATGEPPVWLTHVLGMTQAAVNRVDVAADDLSRRGHRG